MADREMERDVAQAIARLDALGCDAHAKRMDRVEERLTSMEGEMQTIRAERRVWNYGASVAGSLTGSIIVAIVMWLIFKSGG